MTHSPILRVAFLAVVACDSSIAEPVQPPVPIEATADGITFHSGRSTFDGSGLHLELTATNHESTMVTIVIRGGSCLLIPQAYRRPDRTDRPVSGIVAGAICPDVGYELSLAAGGSEVLTLTIQRNRLPFRSGFFYLSVLVEPPSGRREVAAGSARIE